MISDDALKLALGRLSAWKFFPGQAPGIAVVAEILLESNCTTEKDFSGLVDDLVFGSDEWPGPRSFREWVSQWKRSKQAPSTDGCDPLREWQAPWKREDRPVEFPDFNDTSF